MWEQSGCDPAVSGWKVYAKVLVNCMIELSEIGVRSIWFEEYMSQMWRVEERKVGLIEIAGRRKKGKSIVETL